MSGGHFNYVDRRCKEEIFGSYSVYENRPSNAFEDLEISELVWDVFDLIHEYDLYASGDTGKSKYLEKKNTFKKKWLGPSDDRVRAIINRVVDNAKKELYETFVPRA